MSNRKPRTWDTYNEMRRTDKKRYYSGKVQREMLEDREQLGQSAFYNTPKEMPADIDAAIATLKQYLNEQE